MATQAFKTEIHFIDGCTDTEIHSTRLTDEAVLKKLFDRKIYQKFPGSWELSFPTEHRSFEDQDFVKVIHMGLRHIYDRDNPNDQGDLFF
jgi:hypothetical protein